LEIVRELKRDGKTVAVVGDGINDALALAHSDVSVATAGATDAAREASDVLLMEDDLRLLVEAFSIARSAMGLVRGNFAIVAAPNAAALALAATGLLGPPGATLINNGSTIAAGLNGLRPLFR
jgi:Cu2+-exporting ATPase